MSESSDDESSTNEKQDATIDFSLGMNLSISNIKISSRRLS